jgi:hypothetical protein
LLADLILNNSPSATATETAELFGDDALNGENSGVVINVLKSRRVELLRVKTIVRVFSERCGF